MKRLFSSCKVGNLELENRIAIPAMHLGFSEGGFVDDQLIRFYRERARGGAGLIIVGGAYVHRLGIGGINFLSIDDDKYIPGLRSLTDALRAEGTKTSVQLFHAGRYAYSFLIGEQPVSSSEVRSPMSGDTPRALTIPEIQQLVQYFMEGARRAKEAGFDSVEISGATGYLVSQFLSPFTNQRSDEYGGSLEKRVRFASEIVRSIKTDLGEDYPIIFRLTFDDLIKGGNGVKEATAIAKILEQEGVDALDMQVGWHESRIPTIAMLVPRAAFAYLSREVKKEVNIPVMVTNRINDPVLADELLQDGVADLIGMGRPLIADPYLPLKAKEERFNEIRPCIACNQGCFDSVLTGMPVTCLVNPAAGREEAFEITPVETTKTVLVVGSGPGGLEASRVLAERGHEVLLYEKEDRLGGKLNLCHLPPGRKEFIPYIDHLIAEMKRLNINVITGVEVSELTVSDIAADAVVLATGASQTLPEIPGIDMPHVYLAESVLEGKADLGEKVVVIGGGAVGCETALFLAMRGGVSPSTTLFLMDHGAVSAEEALNLSGSGRSVTIVEMLDRIGTGFGRSYRWVMMQNLRQKNVAMMSKTKCLEIKEKHLVVETDGERQTIEADTVVVAAGYEPLNALYIRLEGKVPEIYLIGDAKEPRKCLEAVYEGAKIGREL
jgi:2,4-dienoyl-CoA reductase (NADPH2)